MNNSERLPESPTGTYACPHCGVTKQHAHEIRVPFAVEKLDRAIENLARSHAHLGRLVGYEAQERSQLLNQILFSALGDVKAAIAYARPTTPASAERAASRLNDVHRAAVQHAMGILATIGMWPNYVMCGKDVQADWRNTADNLCDLLEATYNEAEGAREPELRDRLAQAEAERDTANEKRDYYRTLSQQLIDSQTRCLDALRQILADHDERVRTYAEREMQENRMRVMQLGREALSSDHSQHCSERR